MQNHIKIKKTPQKKEFLDSLLHPICKKWFYQTFTTYSPAQLLGVYSIHCRENILLSAPTGSTKTLTAFLSILNQLVDFAHTNKLEDKVYAIYVSPLKALNEDIRINLEEPLMQMAKIDSCVDSLRVGVRTGDTSPYNRQKMLKKPPHILITTPESLALLMSSQKFCAHLRHVEWFIVDEIHSFARGKRGVQLSLLMEQLQTLCGTYCRVGLSATVSPLEKIGSYLVGTTQECLICQIPSKKQQIIEVVSPVSSLLDATYLDIHTQTFALLHDIIQNQRTILVFTNTRSMTEKVVHTLKALYPNQYYEINEEPPFEKSALIGAHHSSLSQEHRREIEHKLKIGKLKCVVCSTSLELGIDIGFIDTVVLLTSPKQVSRLLQRIGRSGHKLDTHPKGILIPQTIDDLIESVVLAKLAKESCIEDIQIIELAYDVLMQHIIGRAITPVSLTELFNEIKRTYSFEKLDKITFLDIISILVSSETRLEQMRVYPKLIQTGEYIQTKSSAIILYRTNIGTIADSGRITVKMQDKVLGNIDEGFLEILKPKDLFILGGETYMYLYTRGLTIQVKEAFGRSPTVPQWFSQSLTIPFQSAYEIRKHIAKTHDAQNEQDIQTIFETTPDISTQLFEYITLQKEYGLLFKLNELHCEVYKNDEDVYYSIVTYFGKKCNYALALFFSFLFKRKHVCDIRIGATDSGFYLQTTKQIELESLLKNISIEEIPAIFKYCITQNEALKHKFRQCLSTALFIVKNYKGHSKSVGKQQMASHMLLSAIKSTNPNFVLIQEAIRELMNDTFDVTHAQELLQKMICGIYKLKSTIVTVPSVFSIHILSNVQSAGLSQSAKKEYMRQMYHLNIAAVSLLRGKQKQKTSIRQKIQANASFTYQTYWDEQKPNEPQKNPDEQIKNDILYAMQKVDVEPQIQYELYRLLEGENQGFSVVFLKWLADLLKGSVPKFWSDVAVQYLQRRLEDIKQSQ